MVLHDIDASGHTPAPAMVSDSGAGAARFSFMSRRLRQGVKLARLLPVPLYRAGLRVGVGAAIEHRAALAHLPIATAIDIGANKGQFSLFMARSFPAAQITAFEPLPGPADLFRRLFAGNPRITLHQAAIGPTPEIGRAHF